MATVYSNEKNAINGGKAVYGGVVGGRMRRYRATVSYASQASGTIIELIDVPAFQTFAFGVIFSSVALGTATLSVGTADEAAAYRTAATVPNADTPVFFGKTAQAAEAANGKTGVKTITATVGAAALPASGTLVVDIYTSGV